MDDDVNECQIHGLPFIKVTRRRVAVEIFDKRKKQYRPHRMPPERDSIEYLCEKCDVHSGYFP